mmetsp:Transcript_37467/g.36032  ORF Transcript_37467/g.36032 Transcript_37467/m.36032 type:complete len:100 (+) Transcript_37467:658-957(+)
MSSQTPGFIYNSSFSLTKPRIMAAKYYPSKEKGLNYKVKKSDQPAPGSYDPDKSIIATQWTQRKSEFAKKKHQTFIDVVKKDKSFLPGVGHYKNVDTAF